MRLQGLAKITRVGDVDVVCPQTRVVQGSKQRRRGSLVFVVDEENA
jgi:hypothetical protein